MIQAATIATIPQPSTLGCALSGREPARNHATWLPKRVVAMVAPPRVRQLAPLATSLRWRCALVACSLPITADSIEALPSRSTTFSRAGANSVFHSVEADHARERRGGIELVPNAHSLIASNPQSTGHTSVCREASRLSKSMPGGPAILLTARDPALISLMFLQPRKRDGHKTTVNSHGRASAGETPRAARR